MPTTGHAMPAVAVSRVASHFSELFCYSACGNAWRVPETHYLPRFWQERARCAKCVRRSPANR